MKYTSALAFMLISSVTGFRNQETKKDHEHLRRLDESGMTCTIDHDLAESGSEEVSVHVLYNPTVTDAYFFITVQDEPWAPPGGSVSMAAWCVDIDRPLGTGTYSMDIFSAFDKDQPFHSEHNRDFRAVDKRERLPMLAYLINNWNIDDYIDENVPGFGRCRGHVTYRELQWGVWKVIDDKGENGHSSARGQECIAKKIAMDSIANGADYVPNCLDDNEQIPLLYVYDKDQSDIDRETELYGDWNYQWAQGRGWNVEEGVIKHQVIISETPIHSIPGMCDCGVPTGAPTEAPTDPPAPDADPTDVDDRSGPTEPYVKGDPHFKTFGGEHYDFHGECDMVLVHNPKFKNNLGMDIHIRTKIDQFWSSVETAAMKLGDDTIEVTANPESEDWLWINGHAAKTPEQGEWYRSSIAGFLVRYKESSPGVREAVVYINGSNEKILFKTFKSFIRLDVDYNKTPEDYEGAVGLLGSYDQEGLRVARDGKTFIENPKKFGQEWQVVDSDPRLFHSYEGAIINQKCKMPPTYTKELAAKMKARRLGESGMTEEDAQKACEHLKDPEDVASCVYDVIATQDLSFASVW